MNLESSKGTWTCVIALAKNERFKVDTHDGRRTVHTVKVTRGDDGLVHASLQLLGPNRPPAWSMDASHLPDAIRDRIAQVYGEWRAQVPPVLVFGEQAKPHQPETAIRRNAIVADSDGRHYRVDTVHGNNLLVLEDVATKTLTRHVPIGDVTLVPGLSPR